MLCGDYADAVELCWTGTVVGVYAGECSEVGGAEYEYGGVGVSG